jgi:hypothetical protein
MYAGLKDFSPPPYSFPPSRPIHAFIPTFSCLFPILAATVYWALDITNLPVFITFPWITTTKSTHSRLAEQNTEKTYTFLRETVKSHRYLILFHFFLSSYVSKEKYGKIGHLLCFLARIPSCYLGIPVWHRLSRKTGILV